MFGACQHTNAPFRGDHAKKANMTHLIQHTCIDRMFGKDEVAKECVMRTTAASIRELEGPDPSPLETLLAQQIALDRLYLQHLEFGIDPPPMTARSLKPDIMTAA